MPLPFFIVDGYNLMHAAGIARSKYNPGELEKRRNQFLKYLAKGLGARQRARTIIVFDAADAPAFVSREATIDEMKVLFAQPGGDADSLIEELLAAHSSPRQVRVVSSDRRLQTAARRRRGSFITSEDFVLQLDRSRQRPDRAADSGPLDAKFGGEIPAEETARWLEVFGDIPEARELQSEDKKLQRHAETKETRKPPPKRRRRN